MSLDNFFLWFLNEFVKLFTFMFDLLDSIQFMGISLLTFIISIVIIGTVLPIILTLVKSRGVKSKADRSKSKNGD